MSELKDKGLLFDIEKNGVYYKKLAGNVLMVVRRIGWSEWWKTSKHVGYTTNFLWKSYSSIVIPKEVDGMRVVSVEGNEYGYSSAEIKNVSFPDTINTFGNNLEYISNVVFPSCIIDSHYESVMNCNNLTLPNSVQTIDSIRDCNNVVLPNSMQTIGEIINCNNITIPDTVQTIGDIFHCDNLVIPNTIRAIGKIQGCSMLTIPKAVVSIKGISKWYPSTLKMESPNPPVLINCDPHVNTVVFVPQGSLDTYKNDPMWGKIKTIREDPSLGEGANPTLAKQTPVVKQPTETEMKTLDRLIDAALEDFVVTDEERSTLLKKADSIGLSRDEFKMLLDSRIQRRMKEKPDEKIEEKKKGFFARLFGK